MKHQQYNKQIQFVKEPVEFNKYTPRELLGYCLGGNLYMPSSKDMAEKIIQKSIPGLTTMTMCFEDAIGEEDLAQAQDNVIDILNKLAHALETGEITRNDLPLYFLRVRNVKQFKSFTKRLTHEHFQILTGFIFPKFTAENGHAYLEHLDYLNKKEHEILYGMPILESPEIIYKETRMNELVAIQSLLNAYRPYILNVRVGATDFSSKYGLRRGVNYNIYNIKVVSEVLCDILNFFTREGQDYPVSAPVWEYFSNQNFGEISRQDPFNIHNFVLRRKHIVNEAVDGLLNELAMDKANGFVGKTVIHPSHLPFVNGMQAITAEEYNDALMIMNHQGEGVMKGENGNKMNEMNPHKNWAKKTLLRAEAYGVIPDNTYYPEMFVKFRETKTTE